MAERSVADPLPLRPDPARLTPVRWAPPPLPADFGGFVGRGREIDAVVTSLATEGSRLVTLTGPGGVGKTRLALRVAARFAETGPVGFASLASVRDPADVLPTIRDALGIDGDHPPLKAIRVAIGSSPCLLVLDNFEQIVEAAPRVAEVLAGCAGLTCLVASRRPLRLRGEQEIPVPPLPVPDPARLPALPQLAQIPSVDLFVQRAHAGDPGFALTVDNAEAIAAICTRLAGLPLAIELAAAWIKVLPPAALLARLSPQLPLLAGGGPDLPARLRTMHDAIAWSYDLLSEPAQRLFRILSVFPAGAPLSAVERVGETGALPRLADLVETGLVRREGDADAPRFTMLEPIREFARDRLDASGEVDLAHNLLFGWLLDRVSEPGWPWDVPGGSRPDGDWFAGCEREHENVRAALAWAEAHDDGERMLQLAAPLFLYWWSGKRLEEGRGWLERGLAAAPHAPASLRAQALGVLSGLAHRRDDNAGAARLARAAYELWDASGNEDGLGFASYMLAISAYRQGDLDAADRLYGASLRHLHGSTLVPLVGEALLGLAQVARDRGDLDRAATIYEEALALQDAHGIAWGRALACYGAGTVAHTRGDLSGALVRYQESVRYWHGIADWGSVAVCLEGIAGAVCGLGNPERAARLLGAAQTLRDVTDYPLPDRALASYGRIVAGVYGCLGARPFVDAWLAGRALSPDAAVADACRPSPSRGTAGRHQSTPVAAPAFPFGLSRREVEVLRLVSAGRTDKEIAEALSISHRTVTTHVSHVLGKLGVSSRVEAAAWAVRSFLSSSPVQ